MNTEPCSSQELPTDLVSVIVARLPVKSLLQFRSVSKPWCRIIEDPKFLESYRNLPDSQISVLCIDIEKDEAEFSVRCSKTFRSVANHNLPAEIEYPGYISDGLFLFDSDGLFLFESKDCARLFLWNPFIRKVRILRNPSPERNDCMQWSVGMGYDPWVDDYKHVRFTMSSRELNDPDLVMIYTVGTDSWKTIPFKTKGDTKRWRFYFSMHCYYYKKVCFRGVLYLIAELNDLADTHTIKQRVVSFDLRTEEFDFTDWPVQNHLVLSQYWHLKCASDGSRLALFAMNERKGWIWWAQGEGGDVTWIKHYKFRFSLFSGMTHVLSIDINVIDTSKDEESVVLLLSLDGVVISYNLEDRKEKILFRPPDENTIFCAGTYRKSFALLNKDSFSGGVQRPALSGAIEQSSEEEEAAKRG